jgi:hypothetical protein
MKDPVQRTVFFDEELGSGELKVAKGLCAINETPFFFFSSFVTSHHPGVLHKFICFRIVRSR